MLQQRRHRVVVAAAAHHRVDLDRCQAGVERGGDAVEHLLEAAEAAAHVREHLGVERVEAHRDAPQAVALQFRGVLGEQHPVGGEREIVDALDHRQLADQFREPRTQQRFAPGETQLAHAERGRGTRHAHDFLEAEPLAGAQEAIAVVEGLPRHAVRAAEIAAVHHREAQVVHRPAEPVARARRCAERDDGGVGDWTRFRHGPHQR